MNVLEQKCKSSHTTKLHIDVRIKPLYLCLLFTTEERKGIWLIHFEPVKNMIPLFFAAGHVYYGRWELYYLRSMEAFPNNVQFHCILSSFLQINGQEYVRYGVRGVLKSAKKRLVLLGNQQMWQLWKYGLTE